MQTKSYAMAALNKIIVFSAPSGSGKTTIAREVVKRMPQLQFSISGTNRNLRGEEKEGVDYYKLTTEEFNTKIANHEFAESEEVYPGRFYGTLKSEIERIFALDQAAVLDIDVKGAQQIKSKYGDNALLLFIKAPSLDVVKNRLENRKTESSEDIQVRLDRIPEEMTYEDKSDKTVINDDLETAIKECMDHITQFLGVAA